MNHQDCWKQDEFEDEVASALIAVYENKVLKNRGAGPLMLKTKDLLFFRQFGPYIPSESRLIYDGENVSEFDILNDGIPEKGLFGIKPNNQMVADKYKGYFMAFGFKRINRLPKWCVIREKGYLYEQTLISATQRGIIGEKNYYTLTKAGKLIACDKVFSCQSAFGKNYLVRQSEHEPALLTQTENWASASMQFVTDARFCWSIRAEEAKAKVTLGCMKEEIKSLLYARSLPVTETGRKRPVLHLVESHKRRLKNGIDIDITAFLRGTQKVEMNGTLFIVLPPKVSMMNLSKNSVRYFETAG